MRFLIEIAGEDQPALIRALDSAREHLISGGCHLNLGGSVDVHLSPATERDEAAFRYQYHLAHPKPEAQWTKEKPCAT